MKGLHFTSSVHWRGQYERWKKCILVFFKYNRPITRNELKYQYGINPERAQEILDMLVEEGIVIKHDEIYPTTYELNMDKLRKKVMIVNESDYDEYMKYVEIVKNIDINGMEWTNEAIKKGLKDEDEISKYIIKKATEKMEKSRKTREKNKNKNFINVRKKSYHKFDKFYKDGTIGKVLRGEISIDEYEEIIKRD